MSKSKRNYKKLHEALSNAKAAHKTLMKWTPALAVEDGGKILNVKHVPRVSHPLFPPPLRLFLSIPLSL